jgi:hypothetical protein
MFAVEEYLHDFLMESPVRTLNPDEADWFYAPVYTTCDLTPNGLPLPFKSPRVMRSAISYISSHWPYWNRTEGADHFFVVPHDFAACFHYQVPTFPSFFFSPFSLRLRSFLQMLLGACPAYSLPSRWFPHNRNILCLSGLTIMVFQNRKKRP